MSTPWYALNESQGFKWTPTDTHAHSGIDLATGVGRPITAPFDGTQISEGTEPWGGQENLLVKDSAGGYEVLSWLHMSDEVAIAPGSPVHAGDLLGHSGTPPPAYGNGPHIHFERTVGKTPPYMGYNPWYPSKSSYPLTPQPVLDQLKGSGEGGTIGAPGAYTGENYVATTGPDPFGIGAAFTGFEQAIGTDVANVQNTIADTLKRVGVFVIGAILAIVGLIILFRPVLEDVAEGAGDKVTSLTGMASQGAKGLGGKLSEVAEVA